MTGLDLRQLRDEVVRPVLQHLDEVEAGQAGTAAEQLLLGTVLAESGGQYLSPPDGGTARSVFQIEPAVAQDVHDNFLARRQVLRRRIDGLAASWPQDMAARLAMCPPYATAIARQIYRRDQAALPPEGNAALMAAYWKRVFNSAQRAGDPAQFAALFETQVLPLYVPDLPSSTPMSLGFAGPAPPGYEVLVARRPELLRRERETVDLTHELVSMLIAAQVKIDRRVQYRRDLPGNDDWREALTAGDCEDIAIAILVLLTAEGFPAPGALRLVLCKTETGEAHAVLAVFTERGVFVLDNRTLGLWPWRRRPYDWVAVEIPGRERWQTIIDPA